MDRQVRADRRRATASEADSRPAAASSVDEDLADAQNDEAMGWPDQPLWQDALLRRLHRLSPDAFEEFVVYLLKTFGMELERVGGTGDEGIDGIGLAPISPVLGSRVAVQAKRYDPSGKPVSRDHVALFQRDAAAVGAERAVFVTLGRFSEPARKAAIAATPTVNLIDGERLCELVEEQSIGLRTVVQVDEAWFDRFEPG